jgi:dTDP-4-dehydrorhamnose 3,5-epimerase
VSFVQDNQSLSRARVLRGLHYQVDRPQGKLVRAVRGSIWDVAVDIRPESPAFGTWVACEISAENRRQLWVPAGLAHGFLVLSESAEVLYKTTDYYSPPGERCIIWNDPELGIEWPLESEPVVSGKDQQGMSFAEAVPRIQA